MKFSLQTVSQCSGRLGVLSDFERLPTLVLETPMLMLHTKGGVIPHLTHDTVQMVTKETQVLNVSVESSLQCLHPTSELKKCIADFIGMKEHLVYSGVYNTATVQPRGYNGKLQVSVWTKAGREVIDADRYMDIMEAFQPDFYQALSDNDTDQNSTKKRLEKAMDSTYDFFKTCRARHKESKALKNSSLLAVLGGGYCSNSRANASRKLGKEQVSGFIIDGFCANGSVGEDLAADVVSPLVKESLRYLPNESFRLAPGCWSPEVVWQLVKLGVDAFDSSLPSVVTERGAALNFQFCPQTQSFTYESQVSSSLVLASSTKANCENEVTIMKYEINLRDTKYREALEPLVTGCQCVTCLNHSKSYVHHLLSTQELLAPVLLMMHNLHHYLEFFKKIREAVKSS